MLRIYNWRGSQWQFDEAEAPADAVLVDAPVDEAEAPVVETAAVIPANKARRPRANKDA